jgi:diguanylate cyclase (GGDEF)-like protein
MIEPMPPIEEARARVLIVDDSVEVHRLLHVRLKHDEMEFESAYSGEEGYQKAVDWQPALILMDLDMRSADGLETLKRLKNDPRTRAIPVIVISASQVPQHKVAAFDLGAVDYITKPFEIIELRVRTKSALRLHQLLQLLAQRAQIDGLTGLWNRAFFDRRWHEEYARSQRHSHPLAVAMIDIDHFKGVNDAHGHPMGDSVLQGVARILRRELRQSDLPCRYGGEEFVLVMPDTNAHDAAVMCERIRQAVGDARWGRAKDMVITASIGVAGCDGAAAISSEEWVEAADKNLYAAKRSGRNRVVVSTVPTLQGAPLRQAG